MRQKTRKRYGDMLMTDGAWADFGRRFKLAPRELAFVRGRMNLLTEKRIAAELGISEHTLHTYAKRTYVKLKVSSRTELTIFYCNYLLHYGTRINPTEPEPAPTAAQ